MPLSPSWSAIFFRLALTVLACAVLGFNRGVRGHAAGLRTTILVGLAASAAMSQANILLDLTGKTPASFAVMDLMRLPLGILTGVGFIGGGTILKRGDLVTGVTTAATLWLATVIGLCIGGGQVLLGEIVTLIGGAVLLFLGWADRHIPRQHRAMLAICVSNASDLPEGLEALITPLGYHALFRKLEAEDENQSATLWFEISWRRAESKGLPLDLLNLVSATFAVRHFALASEARH